jgi:hypothetical protein
MTFYTKKITPLFLTLCLGSVLGACSAEKTTTAPQTESEEITAENSADKPVITEEEVSPFSDEELKTKATELFAYQEGVWDSKWDYIDADGELLGTLEGVETFTTVLDGNIQELINDVPASKFKTKAYMTYNEQEKKILFVSIGPKGDYWILKQDVVSGDMVSEPHINPDGSTQTIRFLTVRKEDNEMDVVMESSSDEGETWTKMFTQYMVRRAE